MSHQKHPPVTDAVCKKQTTMSRRDIEIVGLRSGDKGRNCAAHKVCGECVAVNSLLRLKRCVLEANNAPEEAVKAILVADGVDMCMVGFVPVHTSPV